MIIDYSSSHGLNFLSGKKRNPTATKSVLKLVELQSLVAKHCKMREI